MMNTQSPVRPIHTEADYEAALKEFETYFDNEPELNTPEGDRFELLGIVLAKYEDERFPIDPPEPVAAIRFVMEARGLAQKDLAIVLGSKSRASEIMAGKRPLTVEHIRKLHNQWRIPATSLIGEMREPA